MKKELEFLDVMTPMEKFWVFSTATMFLTQKGNKFVNLTFLSFPVFLRLFKEILKENGMKSSKKFIKDWEWLIYAAFLTTIVPCNKSRFISICYDFETSINP